MLSVSVPLISIGKPVGAWSVYHLAFCTEHARWSSYTATALHRHIDCASCPNNDSLPRIAMEMLKLVTGDYFNDDFLPTERDKRSHRNFNYLNNFIAKSKQNRLLLFG